jgi:UDPglucose--hexose-1-phosphate uridylyltransferase
MNPVFKDHPHRRYNPLTDEWVLVSPHRAKRPWQGQTEKTAEEIRPKYDPKCYLCPGNERASGEKNPKYQNTFAFTNDFSALLPETPNAEANDNLFRANTETGICRVLCFSPDHSLTIPEMELSDIEKVVDMWCREYENLSAKPYINSVQIFENKGHQMGASNPHPHGQIWAQESLPDELRKEQNQQTIYFKKHGKTLLSDYLQAESEKKERIIIENNYFAALVPYWAVWPFESMIIPKRPMPRITDMQPNERRALADIYKQLTVKYDNLFEISFPYSAGIHQAPADEAEHPEWHWHIHFYPPLLRSATVKKFMVGYEMLGNAQRDITPEQAAERLSALPSVHYKK